MKLLTVHPGASSSTADVYYGITRALERLGHEIIPFHTDQRLESFGRWLNWQWRRAGKPEPRPGIEDVYYLATMPILERALWHLPDWVVVFSGSMVHPNVFRMLKRAGAPTMLLLTESPYLPELELDMASWATVCFTNERACVDQFRKVNPHTYYLPHAFDPEVHNTDAPIPDDVPSFDVVFVGTGFEERIELLNAVDWTGIDLGLYGLWDLLGSRSKLRQYIRGGVVPNERAVQLYRKAKIGLNLYRTSMGYERNVDHITTAESLNPRALELAACGVFQISDYRPEVGETFGQTVQTFSSAAGLNELIHGALKPVADGYRRRMADQARQMVKRETFDERAKYITQKLDMVARDRALRIVSRDGIAPNAEPLAV